MRAMACVSCGAQIEVGAGFCAECGAAQTTSCATCGVALAAGARFCGECGTPVATTPVAATEPTTASACAQCGTALAAGAARPGFDTATGVSRLDHNQLRPPPSLPFAASTVFERGLPATPAHGWR